MLESFGFYDDYKPTLRILQKGLGNGGASALLFFCGFVDYITGIWSCLQGFFQVYNKAGRDGGDSAAVGIVRNVYKTPRLMEKSKSLDFSTMPTTTESLSLILSLIKKLIFCREIRHC